MCREDRSGGAEEGGTAKGGRDGMRGEREGKVMGNLAPRSFLNVGAYDNKCLAMATNVCAKFNYNRFHIDKPLGNFRKSDSNKNKNKKNQHSSSGIFRNLKGGTEVHFRCSLHFQKCSNYSIFFTLKFTTFSSTRGGRHEGPLTTPPN